MGITRSTLYNHMNSAGLSTARKEWTPIEDTDLDKVVAEIAQEHPFVGSTIILGHLETRGIHLPPKRVQESLRRVDSVGVLLRYFNLLIVITSHLCQVYRWAGIIKRRVYRVRGANALWHHDGNEKLRPWGFYVHGCIDGYSRLFIYLVCSSNKRASTVADLFAHAVSVFGWPSRARGDFGTENNKVERLLIQHWGRAHRAYLRGM